MSDIQWLLANIGVGIGLLLASLWWCRYCRKRDRQEYRRYLKEVAMQTAVENRRKEKWSDAK